MTSDERRASFSLACIDALRMLGLFLVLPVFVLEAHNCPGGDNPALVGLAGHLPPGPVAAANSVWPGLGPAGPKAGDRGRAGLVCHRQRGGGLTWLVVGRTLQGAGAISAAVTALLADLTREQVCTKSVALIGVSIALMLALSLVTAPALVPYTGLAGLFWITCGLALVGMAVVVWVVLAWPMKPAHANG